jgi:hypothetical protein
LNVLIFVAIFADDDETGRAFDRFVAEVVPVFVFVVVVVVVVVVPRGWTRRTHARRGRRWWRRR